jgi:hypothetical protein
MVYLVKPWVARDAAGGGTGAERVLRVGQARKGRM